jgi:hypothetical protein
MYQNRPMSWCIAMVEQPVSRYEKITAFMSQSFSQMVKNMSVHGLLDGMLF